MKIKIIILVILIIILGFYSFDNNKEISLIVVDTPESRRIGLGGKESLPENTAMLFVFDKPAQHEFWMKDMKFSIDIIWLDEKKKIVHIEQNLSPDTYPTTFIPPQKSLYALEVNAGFTQRNSLKVGEILNFSY